MLKKTGLYFIIYLLYFSFEVLANTPSNETVPNIERSNILLIVVDDMGYTDLGSYGGEIDTPNIDRLANNGLKLTNFHVAPTCSPTRSMLLSGTDSHLAGLGNMAETLTPNQKGQPGYEGYLNDSVVALPNLLRDAGYRTYMTGKWHLGLDDFNGPDDRGFERSYALLEGGAGHFNMQPVVGPGEALYREDGKLVKVPEDFYSSKFYVDKLIEYLEEDKSEEKPFFAYLAFTAPHWPLQAPDESIAKYRGKYDSGYDMLYELRMDGLEKAGIMPEGATGWPRLQSEVAWDSLSDEEKKVEARKMEIYAAMIDDVDVHTGRLLGYLEEEGKFENTLIIFMSDNGAQAMRHDRGTYWPEMVKWVADCCDNSYENMGKPDSYLFVGPNWARAGSGPYSYFKGMVTEGGIRVPGFIHHQGIVRQGSASNIFASVMDIMPTLLEVAGISHPGKHYKDREVYPMKGESMLPFLMGKTEKVHTESYAMGWELFGNRGVWQDDWKVLKQRDPRGSMDWRLYDLNVDPSEQNNLAKKEPEKFREMMKLWDQYAKDNNVILPVR